MLSFSDLLTEPALFSGIDAVRQRFPDGSTWSGYIHMPRPDNGLVFICSNMTLLYEIPDQPPVTVKQGDVLFAPKGSCYKVLSQNPSVHSGADSYTVNFQITDATGRDITLGHRLGVIARDRFSRFNGLVAELSRACNHIRSSRLKIQSAFLNLLDAVLESMEEHSKEYYIIRRGVEQLTIDWNKSEKISKYAWICGISLSYFNAMFKNWAGVGPVEYRNRLRISQAQSILQNSPVSVSETASMVGFEDPFYFSRIFKEITGVSPTAYRENAANYY